MLASIAPRRPEQHFTARAISHFKDMSVVVTHIDDEEAAALARQMHGIFKGAGWKSEQKGITSEILRDGVTIDAGSSKAVQRAVDVLINHLKKYNVLAIWMPGPDLPANTIRVKIGRQPRPYFDEIMQKFIRENEAGGVIMYGNEYYD